MPNARKRSCGSCGWVVKIAGCAILTAGQLATVLTLVTAFEVVDMSDSEHPSPFIVWTAKSMLCCIGRNNGNFPRGLRSGVEVHVKLCCGSEG